MLRIQPKLLAAVQSASSAVELYPSVQSAIELEHSTIPPYLTALFSIKQGSNTEVAEIVESVVGEEMLHMSIACNLMNAIGGSPDIDNPLFIPSYPGPLPMGVHGSLAVHLHKLTRGTVYDTFMTIEEPEEPIDIPVGQPSARFSLLATERPSFATIGEFYAAIKDKLRQLGPDVITGDPARQVADPRWFPADQLFPIQNLQDALNAIDVIVEQGEGTSTSPFDETGQVAHYYRFAEIVYARRLVVVEAEPGWAYAGQPLPLDQAGVWDLYPDAKAVDYPDGCQARVLVDAFNGSYTRLLASLHQVFNGRPDRLEMALSLMIEMRLTASKLVATQVPGTTLFAAPTFEYSPGAGG
jgi:hypothetical protein